MSDQCLDSNSRWYQYKYFQYIGAITLIWTQREGEVKDRHTKMRKKGLKSQFSSKYLHNLSKQDVSPASLPNVSSAASFLLLLCAARTRSAQCYAKSSSVKNKDVGLSEIVPPQANQRQPQPECFTWLDWVFHEVCLSEEFLRDHSSAPFILFFFFSVSSCWRMWVKQSFSLSSFTFSPLRHVCCVFTECWTETVSWQQYVARPVWAGPASPRAAWRQEQDDKSWPHEKVCVGERLTRRSVTWCFTSCLYKFVKV